MGIVIYPPAVHSFKCPQDIILISSKIIIHSLTYFLCWPKPLAKDSKSQSITKLLRLAICLASSSYGISIDASHPSERFTFGSFPILIPSKFLRVVQSSLESCIIRTCVSQIALSQENKLLVILSP